MKYVKLYEVFNSQDLSIIKLEFQKYGINYRTDFEHSLQLGNVFSLGKSGAIINVSEEQKNEAEKILENSGFEVFYKEEVVQFSFVKGIDNFTKNIPLLSKLESGKRIMVSLLFFILLLYAILVPVAFNL